MEHPADDTQHSEEVDELRKQNPSSPPQKRCAFSHGRPLEKQLVI